MPKGQALFKALSRHAGSLTALRLRNLTPGAFASLDQLKNCTGLKFLSLGGDKWTSSHASVDSGIVAWLQNCSRLKTLEISSLSSGSHILQEVLRSPNVRLTDLSVEACREGNAPWYTSLHHQQSLKCLCIDLTYVGTADGIFEAISQLSELRALSEDSLEEMREKALNWGKIIVNRDEDDSYDKNTMPLDRHARQPTLIIPHRPFRYMLPKR